MAIYHQLTVCQLFKLINLKSSCYGKIKINLKERRDEKIISWNTVKEFDAQTKADAIDRLLVYGAEFRFVTNVDFDYYIN